MDSSTFKTIHLCDGLEPTAPSATGNQEEIRDVITEAAKRNESRLKEGEKRRQWEQSVLKTEQPKNAEPSANERCPVGSKTPALGSSDKVTYPGHDAGLLSTVLEAYNKHYNLRTGPEDWWYCIIQTVALAIDKHSKKEEVRHFFVQHEGKKTLTVTVGPSIYGVNYSWFFDQMSHEIAKNINVPEYVDQMKTDFSTTTQIHKIVSEVALMHSMQEFFEFKMMCLCGIPAIEMKGTEQDWERFGMKIRELRKTLEPIEKVLALTSWWEKVETISDKLMETYKGNPDKDWWSRIISWKRYGSGESNFSGWFMVDLLNIHNAARVSDAPSGLVSVPMTISDGGTEEQSAVVAGMIGYKLHLSGTSPPAWRPAAAGVPSVEPVHGWSLLLEPKSGFRSDMVAWEQRING